MVLAIVMAIMAAAASFPPAVAGEAAEPQFISRKVHLDRVSETEGGSTHVLNVMCERGWEIRYAWHSGTPVGFSIRSQSGSFVRAIRLGTSSYSVYSVMSGGQYTLHWSNPTNSTGTDVVYTVKAVPSNYLGDAGSLGGGGSSALTLDEVAIICIAGILTSAFCMGMLLGAMYVHPTPWRRPGAALERRCLEVYSQAYDGGARPPEGPSSGRPR